MKVVFTVLFGMVIFVSPVNLAFAGDDIQEQPLIEIDLRKVCLFEGKAYSVGAKLTFTYNRPNTGLLVQDAQECREPNPEKKDIGAQWKTFSVSCKSPISNKPEGCI